MEKVKNSRILLLYLKSQLKFIIFYVVSLSTFAFVVYLYNIPLEALFYGALLCTLMGIGVLTSGFFRILRHYRILENLKSRITLGIEGLPRTNDLLEGLYQDLIKVVYTDRTQLISNVDDEKRDIVDYFTMWVHQIKTPISAMWLLLQSSKCEESSELSIELFKIEEYVEMVLQYMRLGSDSSDLVLKKCNLDDIIKQSVRKYAKVFVQKKISLKYDGVGCEVLTDEKWLGFVIDQLLSNALKYTKNGSIYIYLEPSKKLVVEDTGIGIAQEDIPRVFEKGYTGYNGRTHKKSTGIGLYLCKEILEKLSHAIAIESSVGKGTRVIVDLETVDLIME